MYQEEKLTKVEEDDQCYTCLHFLTPSKMCPFLEALATGIAFLAGDVLVKNCSFYEKFERKLRIVE